MALTESKKLKVAGGPTQLKAYTIGATETTFYEGEFVMVGGDNDLATVMSSSSVSGNQFVGVVPYEQTVPANGKVTVLAGPIVVSGSGFTAGDANKLVYAATSAGVDASWTEGELPIGRYLFTDAAEVNAVVNVGSVVSGTTV